MIINRSLLHLKIAFAFVLLSLCNIALAVEVNVLALFKDKAMLQIDGKQRLVKKDKPTPEGITLISSNSDEAVLEINGKRSTYKLGTHLNGSSPHPPDKKSFRIYQSNDGMYHTVGSIKGFTVNFLVDTGASTIAMNSREAKRMGINYRYKGTPVTVSTASGVTRGYSVKLDAVKVGHIVVRNVDAIVLEGDAPYEPLLGMSFLREVEVVNKGKMMLLKNRF